jgi:hypothetical protein
MLPSDAGPCPLRVACPPATAAGHSDGQPTRMLRSALPATILLST